MDSPKIIDQYGWFPYSTSPASDADIFKIDVWHLIRLWWPSRGSKIEMRLSVGLGYFDILSWRLVTCTEWGKSIHIITLWWMASTIRYTLVKSNRLALQYTFGAKRWYWRNSKGDAKENAMVCSFNCCSSTKHKLPQSSVYIDIHLKNCVDVLIDIERCSTIEYHLASGIIPVPCKTAKENCLESWQKLILMNYS